MLEDQSMIGEIKSMQLISKTDENKKKVKQEVVWFCGSRFQMATLLSGLCQCDGGSLLYRQLPVLAWASMQRRCHNSHTGPDITPSLKLQVVDGCQPEGFQFQGER